MIDGGREELIRSVGGQDLSRAEQLRDDEWHGRFAGQRFGAGVLRRNLEASCRRLIRATVH
jgi:hypothetical protein